MKNKHGTSIQLGIIGKRFSVGSFDETKPNEGFTLEQVTSVIYNDTQAATL